MGRKLRQLRGAVRDELPLIPAFLFILIIFYIPLGGILIKGIQAPGGAFSLDGIKQILGSTYYRSIIGFTFFQALISTILSVMIGLPGAWIMSHYSFPGKRVLKAVITIPFILPSILVVLGFVLFFGKSGTLNTILSKLGMGQLKILYSFKAIIIAHIFYNFPIAIRIISSLWAKVPGNQIMAARSLGAGKVRTFFSVTIHQLFPAILSSSMIIFIYCFMSFAIILVLGGGPELSTVEVEVYRLAKVSLDINKGSSLALIQSAMTLFFMFIYSSLERYKSFEEKIILREQKAVRRMKADLPTLLIILYFTVVLILLAAPPLSVFAESLRERKSLSGTEVFTFKWYREIFFPSAQGTYSRIAFQSLRNSLLYAFSTVLLTIPVSLTVSRVIAIKKIPFAALTELIFVLPLGVSSVILGMSYMRLGNYLPGDFKGSAFLVILVHSAIAMPLAFKSLLSIYRKIKGSLREAAKNLGASEIRIFRDIELPLLKSGILTGATFAFAVSIGEMNATLMLSQPGTTTLPIAIYRLIGSYKFYGACALGSILMLICLLAFMAIDYFDGFGDTL
ncbi:MAG: iron ABC transporter permease [Spirochaetales bacterium]|nr:iron ABC transporter permease [Spirochaetales bacterium]